MHPRIIFKSIAAGGLFLFCFGVFLSFGIVSHAQTATTATANPTFLITWKTTGSYIPSSYKGKALPTYGSRITAYLELVSPTGKLLDLSQQTIYWYANDNLVAGGTGIQQATFSPIGAAPNSLDLRVTLPNYEGNYLVHDISIPMVVPKAVIWAPYPNGQFSQNPVTVQALPYFFNVLNTAGLSYAWAVNGTAGSNTEYPQDAQITLPEGTQSGTDLSVSLSITNPNDSTVGMASENLTYESQL